jgi:5'-3' exonuclease
LEFTSEELGFPFDLEKFIDDFVLFCMLIGNDFLPSERSLLLAIITLQLRQPVLESALETYQLGRFGFTSANVGCD